MSIHANRNDKRAPRHAPIRLPRSRIVPGGARGTAALVCLALLSQFFVVQWVYGVTFYLVPTRSMQPAIAPNDRIVTVRQKQYARGDVVVLRDPFDEAEYVVKRIVGLAGDTVAVREGMLIVNGKPVIEPYLAGPIFYQLSETPVGKDQVFLLGDNRNMSDDGHIWHAGIARDSIAGRVTHVYYPPERSGPLESFRYVFAHVDGPRPGPRL